MKQFTLENTAVKFEVSVERVFPKKFGGQEIYRLSGEKGNIEDFWDYLSKTEETLRNRFRRLDSTIKKKDSGVYIGRVRYEME